MIRTPEEWLAIYRDGDGIALAAAVLESLDYYNAPSKGSRVHDVHRLMNAFTAMQMDGVGRVERSLLRAEHPTDGQGTFSDEKVA